MNTHKPFFSAVVILLLPLYCFASSESMTKSEPIRRFVEYGVAVPQIRTLGGFWNAVSAKKSLRVLEGDTLLVDINHALETLQQIELDNSGHLMLNSLTQGILEEAYSGTLLALTEYHLMQLGETLRKALPDSLGYEAAELAINYFNYLRAKAQVLTRQEMLDTVDAMKQYQDRLVDLRIAVLGYDVSRRLFKKSETDKQYMLEAMMIGQDMSITPEERMARIKAIGEQYHQYSPPIEDWDNRSSQFISMLRASDLSRVALAKISFQLLNENFTEAEIDLMKAYGIDLIEQFADHELDKARGFE